MWRFWIIFGLCIGACAEFPEVDTALEKGDPDTAFPDLLPFEALLDADEARLGETDDAELRARADALRGRVGVLRGPVIDSQTRNRMEDGIQQP